MSYKNKFAATQVFNGHSWDAFQPKDDISDS